MDTEAYRQYLSDVLLERSYDKAATILTDEREDKYGDDDDWSDSKIEITVKELKKNPKLILDSSDALDAGAEVMGKTVSEYRTFVSDQQKSVDKAKTEDKSKQAQPSATQSALLMQTAIEASAKALDVDSDKIQDNMSLMKDDAAIEAASKATNLPAEQLKQMLNMAMISSAKSVDKALDFDTEAYIWLIVGITVLILAFGSISFFASTYFNRTGSAMALGGGLPFAFFLISMIQQQVDSMDYLKYMTLTTLYDTSSIISGDSFGWGLVALAGIATLLYSISGVIFCKKDLPL